MPIQPLATFFGFEALETECGFAIESRNCDWDTPCCCTRLIGQTAGLPVGFTPVRVIQIRDNDPLAGRGMEKLAIANEDTDMLAPATCIEKQQIPRLQTLSRDLGADVGLLLGIAG